MFFNLPTAVQEERAPYPKEMYPIGYRMPYLPFPGQIYVYPPLHQQQPSTGSETLPTPSPHPHQNSQQVQIKAETTQIKTEPPPYPFPQGSPQNGLMTQGKALQQYQINVPTMSASPFQPIYGHPPPQTISHLHQMQLVKTTSPSILPHEDQFSTEVHQPTISTQPQSLPGSSMLSNRSLSPGLPPSLDDTSSISSYNSSQVPSECSHMSAMGPPKHIPQNRLHRSDSQPSLHSYGNGDAHPKLRPTHSNPHESPFPPTTMNDYRLVARNQGGPESELFNFQDAPIAPTASASHGPLQSPTYPPIQPQQPFVSFANQQPSTNNGSTYIPPMQPIQVRRHGSRSSSPTSSIISVGSGPSMGRPGSIINGRTNSISGEQTGSIASMPLDGRRFNHSFEALRESDPPPYTSQSYRTRSPTNPDSPLSNYSGLSGSRPGSTHTASSYSERSRISHRSRSTSYSGPIAASLSTTHITNPPNPQYTYITLEDLLRAEPTLTNAQTISPFANQFTSEDALSTTSTSLHLIITWTNHIPAFCNLPSDVQMKLMKNCWGELLCFVMATHTAKGGGKLQSNASNTYDINQTPFPGFDYVMQRVLSELTSWILDRQLDDVELACLKVIILLDPGELVQGHFCCLISSCNQLGLICL